MIIVMIIVINDTSTLEPFSQCRVGSYAYVERFWSTLIKIFCVLCFPILFCVIYVHRCLCNTKVLGIPTTYLCEGGFGTCSVMSPDLEVLMAHRKLAPAGFLEDAFLIAARSALPSSGDPSSVVTLMRPSAMLRKEMLFLVYFEIYIDFLYIEKRGRNTVCLSMR